MVQFWKTNSVSLDDFGKPLLVENFENLRSEAEVYIHDGYHACQPITMLCVPCC